MQFNLQKVGENRALFRLGDIETGYQDASKLKECSERVAEIVKAEHIGGNQYLYYLQFDNGKVLAVEYQKL